MTEAFVLSNFDTHVFIGNYTDNTTVPASANELEDVINFSGGTITKDKKTYKTLTNDGWDSIAMLGQSVDDIQINLIRQAKGTYTNGATGTDAYTVLRKWFDASVSAAATQSDLCKNVIIARKRLNATSGQPEYEGLMYHVTPSAFTDGDADPDNGQEFNVTLAVFQAPVHITVTKSESQGVVSWAFAAIS
jgi:hypothetical protein